METGIKVPFAKNAELLIVLSLKASMRFECFFCYQECSLTVISAISTDLTPFSQILFNIK